jgi:hypothetical protein
VENAWWRRWPGNTFIIVLAVVLVLVAGLVLYTYFSFRAAAIELILDRDEQLIVLSAARLREEISNLADNLETLALAKELSGGNEMDKRRLLQAASPRLAVYDAGVILLDHRGNVLASEPSRPEIQGEDWSDRVYFRELLADTHLYVSDAVADGPENAQVVVVSVPIIGEQNQFAGALVGMFHLGEDTLSAFYASIVRLRIGQSGGTFVADGNGRILYDTESDLIGLQVTEKQNEMIGSGVSAGVALTKDRTGHQIVSAHAPVPGTTWSLFTEDDWDILTSSTRRYSRILLFSFAAALALPPLGLTILSRIKRFPFVEAEYHTGEGIFFRRVKTVCFPKQLPMLPGWNMSQRIVKGEMDHGDFLFTWIQPDGRLVVSAGWVEGKGISRALALTSTRSCLRSASLRRLGPAEALSHCNEVLCSEEDDGIRVHCLYLIVDPSSGRVEYASAGVPEPLLFGGENQIPIYPMTSPMGIDMQADYIKAEGIIVPGESLVLMGEKGFEAFRRDGQEFHIDALPPHQEGGNRRAEILANAICSKVQDLAANGNKPTRPLHVFVLERVRSMDGGGG